MVTVTPDSRATLRTSMGNLVLEFISDKAPRTCENFVTLAHKGFYDGTKFHRIIKDFIVQGGCPHGNGKGGPGYTIRPEFNDTPHVSGIVSMARDTDPHSAGSQFFICAGEARYLDSRYTAFARVVEGLDVLEKLAAVSTDIQPKYKEKSVPRDPVYLNGVEFEGVDFATEEASNSNGEADAAGVAGEADAADAAGAADRAGEEAGESDGGGQGSSGAEGSAPSGRRSRRGRGRRGKGGGDRSGAGADRGSGNTDQAQDSGAPAEANSKAPSSPADERPAAKKATRKKAVRKSAASKAGGTEGSSSDSSGSPAKKKATRKKATRKKPTKDAKDGE